MISLRTAIDIAYDDVGTGLPVVFLHAFPLDRSLWAPQIGALVDHSRCIAPDLRGFGQSTTAPPYSMDQYADDVVSLLDALGIDRAVVAGCSMGGYIAFAIWRRHRTRVRGLVLANTRAAADTEEAKVRRAALASTARSHGSSAVADRQIGLLVGASTKAKNPALVESIHQVLERAPVEGIVGALKAMSERPDSVSLLASIDVPTLVIAGDEDVLIPISEARAIHADIEGSRFEVLTGAGHLSNVERPAAFNHVTSEFLAQLTCA